jgi:hypothetical protein
MPAVFLVLALAGFVAEAAGGLPMGGGARLLAVWALETLGVVGIYTLLRADRSRQAALLDGLLVAWGAWIFRGPLLVLALQAAGSPTAGAAWRTIAVLLLAYSVAGLVLVVIERWRLRLEPRSS